MKQVSNFNISTPRKLIRREPNRAPMAEHLGRASTELSQESYRQEEFNMAERLLSPGPYKSIGKSKSRAISPSPPLSTSSTASIIDCVRRLFPDEEPIVEPRKRQDKGKGKQKMISPSPSLSVYDHVSEDEQARAIPWKDKGKGRALSPIDSDGAEAFLQYPYTEYKEYDDDREDEPVVGISNVACKTSAVVRDFNTDGPVAGPSSVRHDEFGPAAGPSNLNHQNGADRPPHDKAGPIAGPSRQIGLPEKWYSVFGAFFGHATSSNGANDRNSADIPTNRDLRNAMFELNRIVDMTQSLEQEYNRQKLLVEHSEHLQVKYIPMQYKSSLVRERLEGLYGPDLKTHPEWRDGTYRMPKNERKARVKYLKAVRKAKGVDKWLRVKEQYEREGSEPPSLSAFVSDQWLPCSLQTTPEKHEGAAEDNSDQGDRLPTVPMANGNGGPRGRPHVDEGESRALAQGNADQNDTLPTGSGNGGRMKRANVDKDKPRSLVRGNTAQDDAMPVANGSGASRKSRKAKTGIAAHVNGRADVDKGEPSAPANGCRKSERIARRSVNVKVEADDKGPTAVPVNKRGRQGKQGGKRKRAANAEDEVDGDAKRPRKRGRS